MNPNSLEAEAFREGITRLEEKLFATDDPDIALALQQRLERLRAEYENRYGTPSILKSAKQAQPSETGMSEIVAPPTADAPKATPEQIESADKLLREAQVERMRGNKARVTQLVGEAFKIAPGAPNVLAVYADDLIERGQKKVAMEVLKRVVDLDPTNVAAERRYAELVLKTVSASSMDSLFIEQGEIVASARAATLLSVVLPGAGQFVLGETRKGFVFLGGWLFCVFLVFLWREDLQGILAMAGVGPKNRGTGPMNVLVFVALAGAAIFHFGSIMGAMARGKAPMQRMVTSDRQRPPVDLPFE